MQSEMKKNSVIRDEQTVDEVFKNKNMTFEDLQNLNVK